MFTLRSCASRAEVFVSAKSLHLVPVLGDHYASTKPTRYTTSITAKNLRGKTPPVPIGKKPFFAPVDVSEEVRALAGKRVGVMVAHLSTSAPPQLGRPVLALLERDPS
jgi:hypothetical protein